MYLLPTVAIEIGSDYRRPPASGGAVLCLRCGGSQSWAGSRLGAHSPSSSASPRLEPGAKKFCRCLQSKRWLSFRLTALR